MLYDGSAFANGREVSFIPSRLMFLSFFPSHLCSVENVCLEAELAWEETTNWGSSL